MKSLTMILAAATLIIATPSAYAASWVYIQKSASGTVTYYDTDSVQRTSLTSKYPLGSFIDVVLNNDYSRDTTVEFRETIMRLLIMCEEQRISIIQIITTYPNGKKEEWIRRYFSDKDDIVNPTFVGRKCLVFVYQLYSITLQKISTIKRLVNFII